MKKLLLILIIALLPMVTKADASGTCGANLTWTLDDEGTLTISGSGYMTSHPWTEDYNQKQSIKKVVITGYGIVSSIGVGVDAVLKSLKEGKSGIK